jgi:folate-dependent phosphoribosylglycinamide formyltransferase PurN
VSFTRIVVAISGGGRSLSNLLAKQSTLRFEIVGVVSSNPSCSGNTIATHAGLPLRVLDFGKNRDPQLSGLISAWLDEVGANGVVLAGFLKFWPKLPAWNDRIINIHPALLPKFGGAGMYGSNVHKAVISQGELISGATVHLVDEIYDHGRIISQVEVSVDSSDTAESLANRVFEAECDLLPKTIDRLAAGELPLADNRVWRYEYRSPRKF